MVKGSTKPLNGVVASGAIRGEARRGMLGLCCCLILCRVAGEAILWGPRIGVVHMTLGTTRLHVRTRQRERRQVVIDGCSEPLARVVALAAFGGIAGSFMCGLRGGLIRVDVA